MMGDGGDIQAVPLAQIDIGELYNYEVYFVNPMQIRQCFVVKCKSEGLRGVTITPIRGFTDPIDATTVKISFRDDTDPDAPRTFYQFTIEHIPSDEERDYGLSPEQVWEEFGRTEEKGEVGTFNFVLSGGGVNPKQAANNSNSSSESKGLGGKRCISRSTCLCFVFGITVVAVLSAIVVYVFVIYKKDEYMRGCSGDPGYIKTMDKLSNDGSSSSYWRDWMVPPEKNNSAYSYCYNRALDGLGFPAQLLPHCMDLDNGKTSLYENYMDGNKGFECTCEPHSHRKDLQTRFRLEAECVVNKCKECNYAKNFECVDETCRCRSGFKKVNDKCEKSCDTVDYWFYSCGKIQSFPSCSKRKVCSRMLDKNRKFVEFNSISDLLMAASKMKCTCCFTKNWPWNVTENPVFNYWGPCKPTNTEVLPCESDGNAVKVSGTNIFVCPLNTTDFPVQPIGHPWSTTDDAQCKNVGLIDYLDGKPAGL